MFVCVLTPDSGIIFCLCHGGNSVTELCVCGGRLSLQEAIKHLRVLFKVGNIQSFCFAITYRACRQVKMLGNAGRGA